MPPTYPNRRQFINAGSAAFAAMAGAPEFLTAQTAAATQATGAVGPGPGLIVVNATVYTMDARAPRAEAFAVTGGRFVAVGSTSDIRNLAGKNTQTFDAKGMTVVPGFIDCHNHAIGEVLLNEVLVGNPFEVEFVSIRSIIGKLREKAQTVPAGTWVEGFFFDDTKVSDKRQLTIRDLDEVSSEHPVIVRHRGGHTYFYNSKAFAMAGITKDTPNPQGGTYDKDENGQLNGRVTDVASAPFSKVGTRRTFSAAEAAQRARRRCAYLEAVCALRSHQRAPPERQLAGDAGRAGPRRAQAPFTTYAFYDPDKFVFYGEEMMKNCMAFRSLLDAGVYACAGSDVQPGPFAPLMGIQGMVTRKGWDGKVWGANQRISVGEAIAVNTYNGAWASGEEAIKGSITAGKLADYVVLAADPHTIDVEKIKDIQIVRTVVGGQISHRA